ncbi:MAG: phosphonate C-P lyase system protein PhnH [Candidatus Thiodiazotropha sp. LLP2]
MLNVAAIWTADVQQQTYRSLLDAMSHPGIVKPILWQEEGSVSTTAVLAALLDCEVTLSDHDNLLCQQDWLRLQVEKAEPDQADYILCKAVNAPEFVPKLGTLTSPEQSATLILQLDTLVDGELKFQLSGPGVDGQISSAVSGLHEEWLSRRQEWVYAFPLGVDILFVDQSGVMALPRTTHLELI